LEVRDFVVRGETALEALPFVALGSTQGIVEFSLIHVDFNRAPGRLTINGGVVKGAVIGGQVKGGTIDYVQNDMHLNGTVIPMYVLNNLPNAIIEGVPVFGPALSALLGGKDGAPVAAAFDVVGPPSNPILHFHLGTVLAPGVLKDVVTALLMTPMPPSNSFGDPGRR
jgi:hypothetical protein